MHQNHVNEFTEHINSVNKAIKFTIEREENCSLAMLDTKIRKHPDGSLSCVVYRKPTHRDQYLNFRSHHPLQHKLGVVRTLTHRANTIITQDEDKQQELIHIQESFQKCGYEPWVFNVSDNKQQDLQKAKNKNRPPAKGNVVLPYIQGVSETMPRLFQAKGIRTHYKPVNSIRQHVVAPKDKTKTDQRSGTVYHITLTCDDCDAAYVGESERSLKARLAKHRRPSSTSSPVAQHVKASKHTIDWNNVKVLDQDSNWYNRGVREAINIHRHPSNLNKDKGRHDLAPVYRNILSHDVVDNNSSCDTHQDQ
ncbi:uncharacterized protein [Amphiura filiformis]|uniref:uncharacterized protein n=1 Tax=Amphiura filiformis TaxID=82378 RepID=UPI003B20BA0F